MEEYFLVGWERDEEVGFWRTGKRERERGVFYFERGTEEWYFFILFLAKRRL